MTNGSRTGSALIAAIAALGLVGASAALSAPGPAPDGGTLFKQRCATCHSLKPGQNGAGPSLAGVTGRKAAAVAGFGYSPALRNAKLVWSADQLSTYLAAPQKAVPGTRMPIGVTDPAERAAIIRYLASQR
ncbi:c-type cytochrome [Blastomonas fulva]|uniref:c-type cytochrome n=1 Tax=Blastomonas fulva TaxID=1550728 RepID=UPI003F7154C8